VTQKWADGLQERVGRAVRSARGKRPAQWLADETAKLGHPVSRSQIANLESGRKRGVDLAELMIIAAALGVSPVVLLFPDLPDGDVEMLPDEHTSSIDALQRFTGERIEDPSSNLEWLAYLSRARRAIGEAHASTLRAIAQLAATGMNDDERNEVVETLKEVAAEEHRIQELNRQLAALPGAIVKNEDEEPDHA
jgi:transcriptional regulator with XRE-family HTH domain